MINSSTQKGMSKAQKLGRAMTITRAIEKDPKAYAALPARLRNGRRGQPKKSSSTGWQW